MYDSPTEPSLAKVPKPTPGMVTPLLSLKVCPFDMVIGFYRDEDVCKMEKEERMGRRCQRNKKGSGRGESGGGWERRGHLIMFVSATATTQHHSSSSSSSSSRAAVQQAGAPHPASYCLHWSILQLHIQSMFDDIHHLAMSYYTLIESS